MTQDLTVVNVTSYVRTGHLSCAGTVCSRSLDPVLALSRELLRQVRRLDEFELRRLLIVIRGLLVHADGEPAAEPGLPPSLSYRQEHVRCGKAGCSSCPHGPYWYAYWKEDGRTRKRYIGRQLPGEPLEQVVPDANKDAP